MLRQKALIITILYYTWLRAEPLMTIEGLTASGGTGNTVTIIQSGRECLGFIPRISHSSSEILLKISWTRSAVSGIFFSWESSLISFHSAVKSRPVLLIWGWFRPQPPWLLRQNTCIQSYSFSKLKKWCNKSQISMWQNKKFYYKLIFAILSVKGNSRATIWQKMQLYITKPYMWGANTFKIFFKIECKTVNDIISEWSHSSK